jgi:hypothetical protein
MPFVARVHHGDYDDVFSFSASDVKTSLPDLAYLAAIAQKFL